MNTKAKAPKKAKEQAHAEAAAPSPTSGVVVIKGKPLSTRGREFTGTVISNRMAKTVTVEWERSKFVQKYQRYEKRRTRVKAHDEMNVKIGDRVVIIETRPISKTKHFLVIKKL